MLAHTDGHVTHQKHFHKSPAFGSQPQKILGRRRGEVLEVAWGVGHRGGRGTGGGGGGGSSALRRHAAEDLEFVGEVL